MTENEPDAGNPHLPVPSASRALTAAGESLLSRGAALVAQADRVLRFPEDRSIGDCHVVPLPYDPLADWRDSPSVPARGNVAMEKGFGAFLCVESGTLDSLDSSDLVPGDAVAPDLASLGPFDLVGLSLSAQGEWPGQGLTASLVPQVIRLRGLQALELERFDVDSAATVLQHRHLPLLKRVRLDAIGQEEPPRGVDLGRVLSAAGSLEALAVLCDDAEGEFLEYIDASRLRSLCLTGEYLNTGRWALTVARFPVLSALHFGSYLSDLFDPAAAWDLLQIPSLRALSVDLFDIPAPDHALWEALERRQDIEFLHFSCDGDGDRCPVCGEGLGSINVRDRGHVQI